MEEKTSRVAYLKSDLIIKAQRWFVIVVALFSGWLLSFPFQGRVFYSLMDGNNIQVKHLALFVLLAHLLGLISAGFLIKNIRKASLGIKITLILCVILSLVCLLPKGNHCFAVLPFIGFLAGICLASFGYFFHIVTPGGNRFRTAADLLISSNILMIFLNGMTMLLSPVKALLLSTLPLLMAFILLGKLVRLVNLLPEDTKNGIKANKPLSPQKANRIPPLIILCLFIVLVTIDSGLMYSVINPGFSHLKILSLWYWAIPYVAALFILRNLPKRMDRTIFLFIAISMVGLAFLSFMFLEKTPSTFFLVNTLMMGAFGIFDLFWWSILGEMLDEWQNKARLFGIGLAANVLGIIIGESLALLFSQPEIVALFVVFVGLVLLPLMNKQLTVYRSNFEFFASEIEEGQVGKSISNSDKVASVMLSRREQEILPYLLEGYINRTIAEKLSLSENTVKTHIKNIYGKLEVRSRTELLRFFLDNEEE